MPTQKLTNRSLSVTPPATGTLELWDTVVPGLALRVSYGGTRSWSVMTRLHGGKQIRRKIGNTATHTLAEARDAARDVIRDAAKGLDSHSRVAKEQAKQEAARVAADTLQAVAEAWLRDDGKYGAKNLKSRPLIESRLRCHVFPKIGALPIDTITKKDLRQVLDGIAKKYPVQANRAFADLRTIYRYAVQKDIVEQSPAAGLERPAVEQSRDRVLTKGELAKLWAAFEELGHPFGTFFKVLLLTGARRMEVAALAWDELDMEDSLWRLPGERVKNGRAHLVPLSSAVRDIIDEIPRMDDCRFVFTTTGHGHIKGFDPVKKRLDTNTGVTGWVIHDIRRTVVTGMAEMGIDPHVIEAVVNHTTNRSGVAGIYNRASYLEQRTAALEAWAQHVLEVAGVRAAADNVTELRKAR